MRKAIAMKSNNSTSIQYSGIVKIQVKDKRGRILQNFVGHNEGTVWLFKVIASLLGGNMEEAVNVPHFLGAQRGASEGETLSNALYSRIPVTFNGINPTYHGTSVNGWYSAFSCSIPYQSFSLNSASSAEDNYLRTVSLYSYYQDGDGSSSELATIDILSNLQDGQSLVNLKSLSEGQSLYIQWQMRLQNTTSTTEQPTPETQEQQEEQVGE